VLCISSIVGTINGDFKKAATDAKVGVTPKRTKQNFTVKKTA